MCTSTTNSNDLEAYLRVRRRSACFLKFSGVMTKRMRQRCKRALRTLKH